MEPNATTRDTVFAALLAGTCGMADAVGFVSSGVFAANMTGNTVLVGLALAGQDWLLAGERALTLVTFFAGAMLGRRLGLLARPWMPLLLEALLVGVAALPWPGVMAPVWIIALAMGVQASAFTAFRGVAVSTIVITSSIAHLAEDTQDSLHGRPPPPSGWLLAQIWVAYGAGAVLAGVLLQALRVLLAVPVGILLLLTVWSLRR